MKPWCISEKHQWFVGFVHQTSPFLQHKKQPQFGNSEIYNELDLDRKIFIASDSRVAKTSLVTGLPCCVIKIAPGSQEGEQ